jgi:hypothetical protein
MALSESLRQTAVRELDAPFCFCGGTKEPKRSFCQRCFSLLPIKLQRGLYQMLSEGYAEHYDSCKDWLRIEGGVKASAAQTKLMR